MVVAIRRPRAHDRRALLLEARGELVHGVAVVVRVPGLVAHAEDRHLLPAQVEARKVAVQELVPGRARVPGRRADDERVTRHDVVAPH